MEGCRLTTSDFWFTFDLIHSISPWTNPCNVEQYDVYRKDVLRLNEHWLFANTVWVHTYAIENRKNRNMNLCYGDRTINIFILNNFLLLPCHHFNKKCNKRTRIQNDFNQALLLHFEFNIVLFLACNYRIEVIFSGSERRKQVKSQKLSFMSLKTTEHTLYEHHHVNLWNTSLFLFCLMHLNPFLNYNPYTPFLAKIRWKIRNKRSLYYTNCIILKI